MTWIRKSAQSGKALESNDDFLEFLKQATQSQSEEYQLLKKNAAREPHISDEMIAKYVKGTLHKADEKSVGDHILFCDICSDKILKITCTEGLSEKCARLYNDCLAIYTEKLRDWRAGLVPGICLATACLIYFLWPSSMPDMISKSYQSALLHESSFKSDNLTRGFDALFEKSGISFSPARDNPAYRAFGAGLWSGMETFAKESQTVPKPGFLSSGWPDNTQEDNWPATQWSFYYFFGRWCYLLHAACQSDKEYPPAFWEQQKEILARIKKDFAKIPGQNKTDKESVGASLDRIEKLLGKTPGKRHRREIIYKLGKLKDYFSL